MKVWQFESIHHFLDIGYCIYKIITWKTSAYLTSSDRFSPKASLICSVLWSQDFWNSNPFRMCPCLWICCIMQYFVTTRLDGLGKRISLVKSITIMHFGPEFKVNTRTLDFHTSPLYIFIKSLKYSLHTWHCCSHQRHIIHVGVIFHGYFWFCTLSCHFRFYFEY